MECRMIQDQDRIQTYIVQIIQQNPVLKNIFDKIYQDNGRVLIVGGTVRDFFLKKSGSDLDFEVYHISFYRLQQILSQFGPVSLVGKSFGVLRLHSLDADWSTPRKDSSGRKPKIDLDPNMSFEQAFKRRDLTINAMGIDVKTFELIDPFGGLSDLKNKILRSPDTDFFVQDPLRLFRVMQFAARFDMQPDSELNAVCKTMDISTISTERIDEEFKKLFLKSEKPSIGLRWLNTIDRFLELFSELEFQEKGMYALDCLASSPFVQPVHSAAFGVGGTVFTKQKRIEGSSSNVKLSAMWGLLSCSLKNVSFPQKIDQPATKKDLLPFKNCIKKYVHASEVVDAGAMIAWYVHYIPQLKDPKDYKWLAHWMANVCNLETLATIGSCLFSQKVIDHFITNAQLAGVLQEAEKPLLHGADLIHLCQGKKLGDLIKYAYEVQLHDGINDKEKLISLIDKKIS